MARVPTLRPLLGARDTRTPTATFLPLDNLPPGWTTDTASGVTLRAFFGDRLRNGVTQVSHTLEKGFLGQAAPTYIAHTGQVAGQATLSFRKKAPVTASFTFGGLGGTQGLTTLDASVDPAPSQALFPIMSGSADVGRVAEAGAPLTAPNWSSSLDLTINNNLRMIEALDNIAAVDIGEGRNDVSLSANRPSTASAPQSLQLSRRGRPARSVSAPSPRDC